MTTSARSKTKRQDVSAIRAMINSMARARYYKNARAIAASYSPHATIFDLEPPRTHLGIDIADMQAWLDT
jgi:ketosteroid isomerase-like protein